MNYLGKISLTDAAVSLVKDASSKLATETTWTVIVKFERKISRWGLVRWGKRFTLFISNEHMDDIIKIIKSLENSSLLIDGATETVKHEIKKKVDFLVLWWQLWLIHG